MSDPICSIIADIHVGNHHASSTIGGEFRAGLNERCREIVAVLRAACIKAKSQLVVAGDLYDTSSPSPEIITEVIRALVPAGCPALLCGNHDQSSYDKGHNALGPHWYRCAVWDRPGVVGTTHGIVLVPFRNTESSEWLREALAETSKTAAQFDKRLLVCHMGIEDDSTPPWLKGGRTSIHVNELVKILDEFGIQDCAAGDWHNHKLWNINGHHITQIGALCPTGWDNSGLEGYGSLLHWHGDGFTREEIPGPRFVDADAPEAPPGYRYYRRVTVRDAAEAKKYSSAKDTTVRFDTKASAEANRLAAAAVRSTVTLEEQVQAYCAAQYAERAKPVCDRVLRSILEAKGA